MSITPNYPANFTPTIHGYTGQGSFRFWCQTVLPLVYDDSLSYYELLNKVVNYLNNAISDISNAEYNIDELLKAYEQLQVYVNDYFSTLDVQIEINNKLEEMNQAGSLHALSYILIPDQFTGSDAEKLQSCVNELALTGGTILINRSLVLDSNITIPLNTNENIEISLVGVGKNNFIDLTEYCFTGTIDDRTGGLWFINLKLVGENICFNCEKLIRLKFNNCYFEGFSKLFISGLQNTSQIFQTIYISDCYIRNVGHVFYNQLNAVFDIRMTGTTMESGGILYESHGSGFIAGLYVNNCCIEGIEKIVSVSEHETIHTMIFSNNYFELNDAYFDLSKAVYIGNCNISDNFIAENKNIGIILLPNSVKASYRVGSLTVKRNTLADHGAVTYLFEFPENAQNGNYNKIIQESNRFNNITKNNLYNNLLPLKNYNIASVEKSAANFNDFLNNCITEIIDNQPVGSEIYRCVWTGNFNTSLILTKNTETTCIGLVESGSTLYNFTWTSGTLTLNQITDRNNLLEELAHYMVKSESINADDINESGVFKVGTGIYLSLKFDSNFIAQIRFFYNQDYMEYRIKRSGTWQNWYRITGTEQT